MRNLILLFILIQTMPIRASAQATDAADIERELKSTESAEDPRFREKLGIMLTRAEKSVKLLREQILQNQSAPFLANLYMQLGDLLTQKSSVLYYLQMEHDKNTDLKVQATKKFSPVIIAQKEAIAVYQQILKEFPKFDKLDKVMYRLAVGFKSIDEGPAFEDIAEKLIKAYPDTREATQVKLLLGQHLFDQQDFSKSRTTLEGLRNSSYPFERNAAKYRLGLIALLENQHAVGLNYFEQVSTDAELKESDSPVEISLKTKAVKSNIKREALIDSVRAYTEVHKVNPDPVSYYSRIAPTEVLFQEAIEKLAYRYIFLKQYNHSIRLLRTLSERTADPQKVVNIYHEVLLLIPPADRVNIPIEEVRYVLEKFSDWIEHFTMSKDLQSRTRDFFETQVREMGTRSHDLAKNERDSKRKREFFDRAEQFYLLYLGFFEKGPKAVKIATNLADVFFNKSNYLESGSYYLRIFSGEFGAAQATTKPVLLQNAILALQKPAEYAFYEQLRVKGLLVKSIKTYQGFDPKKKADSSLNFTLIKTIYEQGFYEESLANLLDFMKKFPKAREVDSAADLILFYFNTRGDFKGLAEWTQKMLAVNPGGPDLRKRLQDVRSKALLRRLDEQVKSQKDYDVFAQGKSYLQTALDSQDSGLRSEAFKQALARSKSEKDVETFIKTATLMARSEAHPQKRSDLMLSTADETLAITRFYETLRTWRGVSTDSKYSAQTRSRAFEKMVKLLLMLRDFPGLAELAKSPQMTSLSDSTKKTFAQEIGLLLESDANVPVSLLRHYIMNIPDEDAWAILFRAQYKIASTLRQTVLQKVASHCRGSMSTAACKWTMWPDLIAKINRFKAQAQQSPTQVQAVEPLATAMAGLLAHLKAYQGSGDPQLDIMVGLASAEVYTGFGAFLERTAKANPALAPILRQKSGESYRSANKARSDCKTIVVSAGLVSPTNSVCGEQGLPSLERALKWPRISANKTTSRDPTDAGIAEMQKKLFLDRKDWKLYFDLAESYLNKGYLHHAAATSLYGMANFQQNEEEFNAVLGCAVLRIGLVGESRFLLKKASDLNGLKSQCLSEIKNKVGYR
jgi:hypothetical protein